MVDIPSTLNSIIQTRVPEHLFWVYISSSKTIDFYFLTVFFSHSGELLRRGGIIYMSFVKEKMKNNIFLKILYILKTETTNNTTKFLCPKIYKLQSFYHLFNCKKRKKKLQLNTIMNNVVELFTPTKEFKQKYLLEQSLRSL